MLDHLLQLPVERVNSQQLVSLPDQGQPEYRENNDSTPVAQNTVKIPLALRCLLPHNKAGKRDITSDMLFNEGSRRQLRSKTSTMNTSA